MIASAQGTVSVVRYLCSKGCDIRFRDTKVCSTFSGACCAALFIALILCAQDGSTAFHYACYNGKTDVCRFLVAAGMPPGEGDSVRGLQRFTVCMLE